MAKRQPQAVDKSQQERFKKTARELEADEDEAAFEERLKQLAKKKPKEEKPANPRAACSTPSTSSFYS